MSSVKNKITGAYRAVVPQNVRNAISMLRGRYQPPNNDGVMLNREHKVYGVVYAPYYNMSMQLPSEGPELYNKDGERMETIFVRDKHCAHDPYTNSRYVQFDRFNFGLNKHLYIGDMMLQTMGKPTRRYGALTESEAIVPDEYTMFKRHAGLATDFDMVFTFSQRILNELPNARYVPLEIVPWYGNKNCNLLGNKSTALTAGGGKTDIGLCRRKTRNISMISSNKLLCPMHKIRFDLAMKCKREHLADTYGNFDGGPFVSMELPLESYRYTIVLENYIDDMYFSERLSNCFVSMTVPIYCGAGSIGKFYNTDGIIQVKVEDLDNIEHILAGCNEQDYESRIPAIEDNWRRIQKYRDNSIWDYMYLEYIKPN